MPRPHALVVGGTGMLRDAVLALARTHEVSVVARGKVRMESLAKASPAVHRVYANYRHLASYEAALDAAVAARGPFDLGVAWIHSGSPGAAEAAARRVRGRFFHLLGFAVADPDRPPSGRRARFEALPGLSYHEVVLGFVVGEEGSRWLRDPEIAAGVLAAVAAGAPRHVVGTVEPWDAHP